MSERRSVPPDLGNTYSWPHAPDCVYVASRGIEWCDCRDLWPEHAERLPQEAYVLDSTGLSVLKSILSELETIDAHLLAMDTNMNAHLANVAENTLHLYTYMKDYR